ncbi:unnamed protein product [Cylicostephanus goldi]|uniref:Uncharacterized protein n=1 Tax=Cylicostephanus goldi TaxID=71465 RepID=A0A3P6R1P0_CYLGO|nr:unnamed protein product [Cylicostephanus goldi]
MKAMFSDTVVLNKGNLPGITNETTLPVQPPPVEAFEVYVDEDATLRVTEKEQSENVANEQRQSGFTQNAERLPLHSLPLQPAAGDARGQLEKLENEIRGFDVNEFGKPRQLIIEDEETVAGAKFSVLGVDKKPERGIVTSTPAHPLPHPPTHEDFFAPLNHVLEEQMKEEQNEEEIYAQSAFMRRRSVAPAANPMATVTKVPAPPKPRTVQAAERSMELALDKMNLGDSKQMEKEPDDDEGDHDRTGFGLADEEITSAINPWDRRVRAEILKQAHKPCYQHDFDVSFVC